MYVQCTTAAAAAAASSVSSLMCSYWLSGIAGPSGVNTVACAHNGCGCSSSSRLQWHAAQPIAQAVDSMCLYFSTTLPLLLLTVLTSCPWPDS
jgi:hypothetical protein